MDKRLRQRIQDQQGFTLIELLVVILIIGILAAVAIPTFLSQTGKANDSNVQAALTTAKTVEESYRTTSGNYASSTAALVTAEPSLSSAVTQYSLAIPAVSSTGYTITANDSKNNITFSLTYVNTTAVVTKSCYTGATSTPASLASAQNSGGCNASNNWGS